MISVGPPRGRMSGRGLLRTKRALCAGALLFSHVATAGGAELSPEAEERALSLYKEGVQFAREGRWKEAETRFEQVTTIRAAPPALFALARAQIENGKFASAKSTLERAAHGSEPEYAAIVEQATEQLRELEPRVPRVELDVPDVQGLKVAVDDVPLGSVRVIELDCCAPHEIVVSAAGKRSFTTTVTLNQSERRRLRPVLDPEGTAPTSEDDRRDRRAQAKHSTRSSVVGPVVLGSAGLAASIAGVIVRVAAQRDYDDAVASCAGDPPRCTSADDVQRGNDARTRILFGTVAIGVGLAAVAGAGVWWALTTSGRSSPRPAAQVGFVMERDAPIVSIRGTL